MHLPTAALCCWVFTQEKKSFLRRFRICAGSFVPLDPFSAELVRQLYPTDRKCFSAKSVTAVNGPTVYEVNRLYLTELRFEFKHISIWLFFPVEKNRFSFLTLLECYLNIVLIWLHICWLPEMPALVLNQTTSICPPDVSKGEAAAITTIKVRFFPLLQSAHCSSCD